MTADGHPSFSAVCHTLELLPPRSRCPPKPQRASPGGLIALRRESGGQGLPAIAWAARRSAPSPTPRVPGRAPRRPGPPPAASSVRRATPKGATRERRVAARRARSYASLFSLRGRSRASTALRRKQRPKSRERTPREHSRGRSQRGSGARHPPIAPPGSGLLGRAPAPIPLARAAPRPERRHAERARAHAGLDAPRPGWRGHGTRSRRHPPGKRPAQAPRRPNARSREAPRGDVPVCVPCDRRSNGPARVRWRRPRRPQGTRRPVPLAGNY
jgi:hypothetical protein